MSTVADNPRFHPLANAFPLLDPEGDEFAELVKDIESNGLNHPIVMLDGKILDGRNRWLACQKLGVPHREVKFDADKDPVAFVWSENAVRRQLSPSQRAMAAAELATAAVGFNRRNKDGSTSSGEMTIREAAEVTGAAPPTIDRAKKVTRKGAESVVKAVKGGELPVNTAARLVDLPKDEQEKIMAESTPDEIRRQFPEKPTRRGQKAADDGRTPAQQAEMDRRREDPIGTTLETLPDLTEPEPVDDGTTPPPDVNPVPVKTEKGTRRRPETIMRDQLVKFYLVPAMVPLEFWTKHADAISKLPKSQLAPYVKDLKATRTEITRLLKLIEEHTK